MNGSGRSRLSTQQLDARHTWRWRATRGAGAAAAVLLAVLLLVTLVPALRTGAESSLHAFAPTPSETLAPGSDRFYFSASVPWTAVSLDGHVVTPPWIGYDPPLALPRGLHQLEWHADPFLPQRCLLSVPYSASNTCSRASYYGNQPSQPAVNLVLLDESLATLPVAPQAAVLGGLRAATSDLSDVVQPGEAYVAGDGPSLFDTVATQPLRATLRFTLDLATARPTGGVGASCQLSDICPFTPQNCAQLCTLGALTLQPLQSAGVPVGKQTWYVVAFARLGWDIVTLTGRGVATDAPISPGGLAIAEFPLLFALSWNGLTWHAQSLTGPDAGAILRPFNEVIGTIAGSGSSSLVEPGCAAMPDYVGPTAVVSNYATARFISAPNPAQGCLAVVTPGGSAANPAPADRAAWYLYRFGVLLAANDLAHQMSPRLPRADASEHALAAQLAAIGSSA